MIRNDELFPETYVLLGQALERHLDLNLAFWSYARALELGCDDPRTVEQAMARIHKHWVSAVGDSGWFFKDKQVEDLNASRAALRAKLAEAARWRADFEAAEDALVAKAGDGEAVDFAAVEAELARRGVTKASAENLGVVHAGPSRLALSLAALAALGLCWRVRPQRQGAK